MDSSTFSAVLMFFEKKMKDSLKMKIPTEKIMCLQKWWGKFDLDQCAKFCSSRRGNKSHQSAV